MGNQLSPRIKFISFHLLKLHHSVLTVTSTNFLVSTIFFFFFSFTLFSQDQIFTVTSSGGKYFINGEEAPELRIEKGKTYRFDISDGSLTSHPIRFGTQSEYTFSTTLSNNYEYYGTSGQIGAYVDLSIELDSTVTDLYYYCLSHSGMGNSMPFYEPASIEVTSYSNTLDNDNSNTVNAGDTIEYTIKVENISTSPISGLSLTTYFQNIGESTFTENGLALTFVDIGGSAEGILSVGETAEYSATYAFDSAANSGSVHFFVKAVGDSQGQTVIMEMIRMAIKLERYLEIRM